MSSLMSTKAEVKDWVRKEDYTTVKAALSRAPCWTLFNLIHIPEYRDDCKLVLDQKRIVVGYAICTGCKDIYITKTVKNDKLITSGTSPLNQHAEQCLNNKGTVLNDARLNFQKLNVKISKEDQVLIKESQSALVAGGVVSLKFCDNEVFKDFAQVMLLIGSKYHNPEASRVLFGKTAVRDNIMVKLDRCKRIIADAVRKAEPWGSFSIVTDMTTDQITQKSWSDLTFIWIENYEIKRGQYACRHWEGGKHTANNIKSFLYEQFTEIGIVSIAAVPIVTDSGRNIVAAVSDMRSQRCMAHRLHTVLSDAWEFAKESDTEIFNLDMFSRNLVTFVKSASNIQEHLPIRLKHGGKTRPWRSLYKMFHSISTSYDALELLLAERSELVKLQSISKSLLGEVLSLLESMCPLWDKLEVGNKPSLQNCVVVGHILMRKFSTSQGEIIHPGLGLFRTKFISGLVNKFFAVLTPVHSIAIALDITLRDFIFIENETERQKQIEQANVELYRLARDYASKQFPDVIPIQKMFSMRQNCVTLVDTTMPKAKKQCIIDPFAEFRTTQAAEVNIPPLIDDPTELANEEVKEYMKMKCPQETSEFDPLHWWGKQVEELPILASLSRSIYCIPATSSESERHFSKHKCVLTTRRATLNSDTLEGLVVVSSNMASGLI